MFFKPKPRVKPAPIDNTLYTELEDMLNYVGFLTPDGGFYRVRQKGSANGEHGLWAMQHLEKLGCKPHMFHLNENITKLIEQFRYAVIMEDVNKDAAPNYAPEYDKLTDAQKNIIDQIYAYYNSNTKTTSHHR